MCGAALRQCRVERNDLQARGFPVRVEPFENRCRVAIGNFLRERQQHPQNHAQMIPWAAMIPAACGILAGGASRRMGRNKALLPFRGKPLLQHQLDLLSPMFSEILISANDPAPYAPFNLRVVPDVFAEPCSLSGIHALLKAATAPRVFVVACDLPFLHPGLVRKMLRVTGGFDVVVPETADGLEPLYAIYSQSCVPAIEAAAAESRWKVTDFYLGLWVDRLEVDVNDWLVEGRSPFTNANTPDDWSRAEP